MQDFPWNPHDYNFQSQFLVYQWWFLLNLQEKLQFWFCSEILEIGKQAWEVYQNKNWNLTRANNKNYIAFKYRFFTVFGLTFIGSKSFCFFFKVPQDIAEAIEINGQKMYRYEDQWKQVLYKVEDANIKLSLFDSLFEAAHKNIVGK